MAGQLKRLSVSLGKYFSALAQVSQYLRVSKSVGKPAGYPILKGFILQKGGFTR